MQAIVEHHDESDFDDMSEDEGLSSSSSNRDSDRDFFNSENQTEEEKVPAFIGTLESEVLIREDSYENFLKANDKDSKISSTHKNTLKMQQMLHISNNLPSRCS